MIWLDALGVGVLAILIGRGGAGGSTSQRSDGEPSAADLAYRLVAGRLSAGLVVVLPAEMEAPLSAATANRRLFLADRSAFGLWARLIRRAAPDEVAAAPGGAVGQGNARDRFAAYVTAHPGRFDIDTQEDGPPVLIHARARACRAALRHRLKTEVAGREAPMLAARATAAATGAEVAGGFIGGCAPAGGFRATLLQLTARQPLQTALTRIAAHFPGAVWVAVETADGQCSLGVLEPGEREQICSSAVTDNMVR